ncbi:hypothetical protein BWI17_15240 [Betaproteobacteria bacterium GR16-43]|nr:hypothetical protein BWI17_15240 [Betaproteobacteria bacterium GR16-43]
MSGIGFLAILSVMSSIAYGDSVWVPFHRIAAMVMGPVALEDLDALQGRIVFAGLAVTIGLSALYGLAFSPIARALSPETAPWIGAIGGVILYSVNFHGFTELFPWMAEMREPVTLFSHAVFGGLLGACYWALREEPLEGSLAG